MKRRGILKVGLISVVLILIAAGFSGCLTVEAIGGAGVSPIPVTPSSWIPSAQIWGAINALISNAGVPINIGGSGHTSVSLERIHNALAELVKDPRWDPLVSAEALIVQLHRAQPDAAAGLALLGPPNDDYYWVVTVDMVQGVLIVRLINPMSGEIQIWDCCLPAVFVAM